MILTSENGFSIHDTAQIGAGVLLRGSGRIGANVIIGDYAVIDGHVEIGEGTRIGHHAVVAGRVYVGRENSFSAFCSIGAAPQHANQELSRSTGGVSIGDFNVFREYTAVYMPTASENTVIGDHCYIMAHSHIDHDAVIGDHVRIASGCAISGYVRLDQGVYVGAHAAVHQRLHIGAYSMVGMGSPVVKNVLPYSTIIQQSFVKVNERGLIQHGFHEEDRYYILDLYRQWAKTSVLPSVELDRPREPVLQPIVDFYHAHKLRCYLPGVSFRNALGDRS